MKLKLTLLSLALLAFTFSFGQIKLEDLNVVTSITGFHFAADFQGTQVFTKNRSSDNKNNYKNFVFNAFVIKDNTLILFTSGDLDNGQYIDQFKKTFYSIKL